MYLRKENRYLHAIHRDSIAIHSLSICKLLNGYLAYSKTSSNMDLDRSIFTLCNSSSAVFIHIIQIFILCKCYYIVDAYNYVKLHLQFYKNKVLFTKFTDYNKLCYSFLARKDDVYALRNVSKSLIIHKLPKVLVLHIKRFHLEPIVRKDNEHISFTKVLDMTPYCTTECIEVSIHPLYYIISGIIFKRWLNSSR